MRASSVYGRGASQRSATAPMQSFMYAINVIRQLPVEKKPIMEMEMGSNEYSLWEFIWS